MENKINKEFFEYWKQLTANNAKVRPSLFLLRDVILGHHPFQHSFTPITNRNKLANGNRRWQGLLKAEYDCCPAVGSIEKKMVELSGRSVQEIELELESIRSMAKSQ